MPKQIHFLGWDKHVCAGVADWILGRAEPSEQMLRLDDTLIVVPTRESGRRLREKMAMVCRANKLALLGARIVTPLFLIQSQNHAGKKATPPLARLILTQTLIGLSDDDCPALFPRGIPPGNNQWALSTAKLIQNLREELSEACLSVASVLEKHADDLQEFPRWRDLGKLEKLYLEKLHKTGHFDQYELTPADAESPRLPAGMKEIIVASVPDPSLLALKTLERLSDGISVNILVAAPEELKDHFDEWGRPLADQWRKRLIDIPAPETNIIAAANPARQAQQVVDLIRESGNDFSGVCIGVPDRDVIPYLQDRLANEGITAFDPADRPVKDHHLYHLIQAWHRLVDDPSFPNLSTFLHNADVLSYLRHALGVNHSELLSELDQLQNRALPQTIADAEAALQAGSGSPSPATTLKFLCVNLKKAVKFSNEILADAKKEKPHVALRKFLEQIFAFKNLAGDSREDVDFKAVAGHVAEILNDIAYARPYLGKIQFSLVNQVVLGGLEDLDIPRHREGAMLELDGWLELAWNDAPMMIITGFNEGRVPDGRKSDIFLPDSLKKILGLRNGETRLARDAYLLSSILAAREHDGCVILIAGKTSPAGDPLKPSRLLFKCPDEQLAARTELVFREIEEDINKPPFSISFKLDPVAPLIHAASCLPSTLHATQFRDYLACPFRFYLKHILKMERTETKSELDARDFGRAIHAVLEKFSGNPEISASKDENAVQKYLFALLGDYFSRNYGANSSFPILYAREICEARLKAFARRQTESAAEGWEIIAGELSCRMALAGMEITGKIDRIDRNRRDGKMRIIDYKTSDTAGNPAETHLKKSRKEIPDYARHGENEQWLDLQMPLYWLMHRTTAGQGSPALPADNIELCYFNLPRAMAGAGIEVWEGFDESLAESAGQCAQKIIERITQAVFWPPAGDVKYDDYESLFNENMGAYFDGEKIAEFFAKKESQFQKSLRNPPRLAPPLRWRGA